MYTKEDQSQLLKQLGPKFKPFGTLPSKNDIDLIGPEICTKTLEELGYKFISVLSFPNAYDVTIQRFKKGEKILEVWSTSLPKAELKKLGQKFLKLAESAEV